MRISVISLFSSCRTSAQDTDQQRRSDFHFAALAFRSLYFAALKAVLRACEKGTVVVLLATNAVVVLASDINRALARNADASVSAPACPSLDPSQFFKAFSESTKLQQAYTAPTVTKLEVIKVGRAYKPVISTAAKKGLVFPLMLSAAERQAKGLVTSEEHPTEKTLRIVLEDSEKGMQIDYVFSRSTCWFLENINDWSFDSSQRSHADTSDKGGACLRRATVFESWADRAAIRNTPYLYQLALKHYLCAANKGSLGAGYRAAILSLSGQAPRLSNAVIEELLMQAAPVLPEAALGLADFYCDQGDYSDASSSCKHPEKSLQFLLMAASSGSIEAQNQLGAVFERGTLSARNIERAMACYRLAAQAGNQLAQKNLKRLEKQEITLGHALLCF